MEKTLELIVTHYNESEEIVAPLLDSILLQQYVDFSKIGIIIIDDGGQTPLSEDFISRYSGKIDVRYEIVPHKGVSAARNAGLKLSSAEYVMFCDCDDMFCSCFGFYYIFLEINKYEFDELNPDFLESIQKPDGTMGFYTHHEDNTFIHGKVYRAHWLKRNNIRFDPNIKLHEDGYFNNLVHQLGTVRLLKAPYYLWKWREGSVCRDNEFMLKTYSDLINAREALVKEFEMRRSRSNASFYAAQAMVDAYYSSMIPSWKKPENKEYVDKAYRSIKRFWQKYKDLIAETPKSVLTVTFEQSKKAAENSGMKKVECTFEQWIKKLNG